MRDNYDTILLERKGDHLLVVTLNRPKAGNSMNTLMGEELRDRGAASTAIRKTSAAPCSPALATVYFVRERTSRNAMV